MPDLDLIVRNGRIVTATEVLPLGVELGVIGGKISCIGTSLTAGPQTQVVDAESAYVTPGGVDSHVHIQQDNSPTGDTWESGSRSAIAGGNTTVIAFASQKRHEESIWPALESYHKKAAGNAFCDYGIHVILTNPTEKILEEELPLLVEKEGITSVKIYMTYEPMKLGDGDLFNIMMRARGLGITTMIHAENNDIIEQITNKAEAHGNLLPLGSPPSDRRVRGHVPRHKSGRGHGHTHSDRPHVGAQGGPARQRRAKAAAPHPRRDVPALSVPALGAPPVRPRRL
ncbi:hypothetical protein G7054_g9352 [Neopestalotiopsis clavispora]|nr:hypothetical protein G7054_g9352 [Neopestalotiopsis clavispora]